MTTTLPSRARSTAEAPAWHSHPATEKQLDLIRKLDGQRDVPVAGSTPEEARILETIFDVFGGGKFVGKGEASAAISYLMERPFARAGGGELPPAVAPSADPVREEGVYEHDDRVYMVVRSGAGRLYAKVLTERLSHIRRLTEAGETVHATFEYDAGAVRSLSATDRVSPERARELGQVTTYCCVCGTKLEDAESVKRGIGPTCAKKYR
jgi:hypothetical protein